MFLHDAIILASSGGSVKIVEMAFAFLLDFLETPGSSCQVDNRNLTKLHISEWRRPKYNSRLDWKIFPPASLEIGFQPMQTTPRGLHHRSQEGGSLLIWMRALACFCLDCPNELVGLWAC